MTTEKELHEQNKPTDERVAKSSWISEYQVEDAHRIDNFRRLGIFNARQYRAAYTYANLRCIVNKSVISSRAYDEEAMLNARNLNDGTETGRLTAADKLYQIIAKLTVKNHYIVTWVCTDEHTIEALAHLLHMRRKNVKYRVQEAFDQLGNIIEEMFKQEEKSSENYHDENSALHSGRQNV